MTRWLLVIVACSLIAGCFPIELSVSPRGDVLIARQEGFVRYDPKTGEVTNLYKPSGIPVFGVYLPKGNGAFLAASADEDEFQPEIDIALVEASGKVQHLVTGQLVSYIAPSPVDDTFSFSAEAEGPVPDRRPPDLYVMKPGDRKPRRIAKKVSLLHRWSPDGKSIYAFVTDGTYETEHADLYKGHVVRIDVADGQTHQIAAVLGEETSFLALSPDGGTLLFTAAATGKVGDPLELPVPKRPDAEGMFGAIRAGGNPMRRVIGDTPSVLYKVDLETGEVEDLKDDVRYAFYCPDGKHLLVGSGENGDRLLLDVHEADSFDHVKRVASNAAPNTGRGINFMFTSRVYPGWLDSQTVMYLANVKAYGSAGTNLNLISVPIDGDQRKNHQPAIDAIANQ